MNFQTNYLTFVFGMMGVKDTTVLSLDNEEFGDKLFENAQAEIFKVIHAME